MISKVIEDSVIYVLARRGIGAAIPEISTESTALLNIPTTQCCGGNKTAKRKLLDDIRRKLALLPEDRRSALKTFMGADRITIIYKDGNGSQKVVF